VSTATALLTLGLLFVNPLPFPPAARLWMLLPLLACVAAVYRATRVRTVGQMPRATLVTFVTIMVGMVAIALAFYLVHLGVRRFL
jgi:hypothetical protein